MLENVNRDTGLLASSGAGARWIAKVCIRTESPLETALPPFRYYYTTRHLKRPPRAS